MCWHPFCRLNAPRINILPLQRVASLYFSKRGSKKLSFFMCRLARSGWGHALYVSPTPLSAPVNLHHQGNWEDHLNLVPSAFPASVPSFWLANTRRASFSCLVRHPHLCLHHIQIWITCVRPIGRIRNANFCLRLHQELFLLQPLQITPIGPSQFGFNSWN